MWLQVSLNVRIKIEQEQLWKNNYSDLAMLFGTLTFTLNEFWYEAVELSKNAKKENGSNALWY